MQAVRITKSSLIVKKVSTAGTQAAQKEVVEVMVAAVAVVMMGVVDEVEMEVVEAANNQCIENHTCSCHNHLKSIDLH